MGIETSGDHGGADASFTSVIVIEELAKIDPSLSVVCDVHKTPSRHREGYRIAIQILNEGRIGIAGQMLGLAREAFDQTVPYTYERKQFGQPAGHFQGMQFQIPQAAIEIEAARLLTYNATQRKEERKNFTKEAAMAKFYASQVAQKVAGGAIEWAGGVGSRERPESRSSGGIHRLSVMQ